MNRRIIHDPEQHDSRAWKLVSGVLTFIAVLAVAALLSIDDYRPSEPPNTDILEP